MIRSNIKKLLNIIGYDIQHLPTNPFIRRQMELFKQHEINLLLDVGANQGQFAQKLRTSGYKGQIISFEPLPDAFYILKANAEKDEKWKVVNAALGNYSGTVTMHISRNSYSSSILDMLPRHLQSASDSEIINDIIVPTTTLDQFLTKTDRDINNIYLKIDTQGFERQVLEGAFNSLQYIRGLQLELSLEALYYGETLLQEMIKHLKGLGFILMALENGHSDYSSGEILQVECIFYKTKTE